MCVERLYTDGEKDLKSFCDRLHLTAASHDRAIVLEVMGRDAGHIAISAGIAGGATAVFYKSEVQFVRAHGYAP
ncbi:MAG TPA: 6-phosphofructokinase [Allocoleopsis sp.]